MRAGAFQTFYVYINLCMCTLLNVISTWIIFLVLYSLCCISRNCSSVLYVAISSRSGNPFPAATMLHLPPSCTRVVLCGTQHSLRFTYCGLTYIGCGFVARFPNSAQLTANEIQHSSKSATSRAGTQFASLGTGVVWPRFHPECPLFSELILNTY